MTDPILRWKKQHIRRLVQLSTRRIPRLDQGRLHEIHALRDDRAAALVFALASIRRDEPGSVFVVRQSSGGSSAMLCGEGLAMLGFAPARMVIVEAGSELDLLRAGLEVARCPGAGTVLLETRGRLAGYDLTASRRFALAAEHTQGRVIVLRIDAQPRSSAARTRWSVASAPSVPLEAGAPGWPAIDVELLRCRDGPAGGHWRLEWDARSGIFREADNGTAISGTLAALPVLRAGAEGSRTANPRAA